MIFPFASISRRISASNSAGLRGATVMPILESASLTSGSLSARAISALSRSIVLRGVP